MPREKPPTRWSATSVRPTMSRTWSTRDRPIPQVSARASRWLRALRPGWTARASSRAPTSCSGAACSAYRLPLTSTDPDEGRSRPMIIRIVVDLPAPFGPRNPVTIPGSTVKDNASTASLLVVPLGQLACLDHLDLPSSDFISTMRSCLTPRFPAEGELRSVPLAAGIERSREPHSWCVPAGQSMGRPEEAEVA